MDSSLILIDNLKRKYNVCSIRELSRKMNYSCSILLNWSSGRSSPSISQLNEIAYEIGVEVSQLLIEKNIFNFENPIWRDNVEITLKKNISRLAIEKDIHERDFFLDIDDTFGMCYRNFFRYSKGKYKNINLSVIDKLANIFQVKPHNLLESENFK